MAPIVKRDFTVDPKAIMPATTPDNATYWEGFRSGKLMLQHCLACGRTRHPVAPVCPHCTSNQARWVEHGGEGEIFSFVRLHRSYLPEFEDLMPLVIASIQLTDGPRMFARIRGQGAKPQIGDPVRLVVEDWGDERYVPTFELADQSRTINRSEP